MIQRIQSIYLLVASVLLTICLFLPWVYYTVDSSETLISPFAIAGKGIRAIGLGVFLVASLALTVAAIFQFKNRTHQMKMVRLSAILSLLSFAVFGGYHYMIIQALGADDNLIMSYQLVVAFPIIALIFYWLAYKSIKKDHDLVRSVDRLR